MKKLSIFTIFCLLTACQGRDTVVNPHEQKKEGATFQHLNQQSLQFGGLSYSSLQQSLNSNKRNATLVIANVITPLEKNIFNLRTLLNPEVTAGDFYQWLNLYTEALYEVSKFHSSAVVDAKLDQFVQLAMHECNPNLDNCQLLNVFRLSPISSRLFILKANRIGSQINGCNGTTETNSCSRLVTEKYKMLAFANLLDLSASRDQDFLSSYLEHANLLLEMDNNSPLHRTSVALFMTLFQMLDNNVNQCEIVKKFDSWAYSKKNSSRHAEISKKLFSLATACDLYGADGQMSESFWNAMKTLQLNNTDANNPSLYVKLLRIRRNRTEMEAARNLGLGLLITKATSRTTYGALNKEFYNEYLYALDRFYGGHIVLEDAKQILLGATRDYKLLIQTFNDYMRLQTFLKMVDSKQFLKTIINRNQNLISSERLFERSILDSEPLAQEWLKLQDGFNNLFIAVKFAVTRQNVPQLLADMNSAELQFKNLSQSLKIMATYPAMHMLAHLISEAQGTVTVRTFWGTINKSATTLYQELWSGLQQPWFRFGDDPASINKFYLLYSLDYNIKGNFVLIQKDADSHNAGYLKGHFFGVLLNKYIGKIRSELEKMYIDDFRSKRTSNPMVARNREFCAFELSANTSSSPSLNMAVEGLTAAIYSGQSEKTSTNYLQPTLTLINQSKKILDHVHTAVKPRIEYAKQILYVAQANGLTEEMMREAKDELQRTENLANEAVGFFASEFKNQKNCFIRMTLAEQYLQYLTVESERAYLAQVHSEMAQLQNKEGNELTQALQALNNLPGRYKDTNQVLSDNPQQNYFDFFSSRSAFNYSQYDFLLRLAQRLENSNSLNSPSAELVAHEQYLRTQFPEAMQKPLLLNRNWSIRFPPNIKDSVLLKDRTADVPLVWNEDREEFIRQGLSALNKANKPFTGWFVDNNKISNFKLLVESALYLFAATDASSSHRMGIGDVFKTMEELVNFVALSNYDIQLFQSIGLESRTATEEMKDVFLATAMRPGSSTPEVLSESLHPFTYLYESFVKVFNINNAIFKVSLQDANWMADQPLENAYLFSSVYNNDVFKMNFQVHDHLVQKLKQEYTETTLKQMNKIIEMRKMFSDKKDTKYSASVFRIVDNQTVTFESASATSLLNNLIHPQKYSNILIFIREYNQSTKDIYGTGELLKTLESH